MKRYGENPCNHTLISINVAHKIILSIIGAIVGVLMLTRRRQKKAKIEGRHIPYGPYEAVFKRPLDVILSCLALTILSPVMAVIGILVRINLGSPVIFTQDRPGKDEKVFRIFKFRTMTDLRGDDGKLLSDERRLTGFGKFLRAASLDELLEMVNIVMGDMALVGPRPLLVEYLPRYNERQARRHEVRPGLTGLAQVSGRNSISWNEKFELDVEYVDHITLFGDLRILFETVKIVMDRSGINSDTSATMEKFTGDKNTVECEERVQ